MRSRWFYFFTAGITFLLGCNPQSKKNTAQKDLLENQQSQKSVTSKGNKSGTDTLSENDLYNRLTTITLPFLPSNTKAHTPFTCKEPALPYTTVDAPVIYIKRQKYLTFADSTFIIAQLKGLQPLMVNPNGGTSFGNFDCLSDSTDCLNTDDYSKIGVVFALKTDSNYICHIMLNGKGFGYNDRGILALITPHGKVLYWIFSNGELTAGNPHGNIIRTFLFDTDYAIKIEEHSVGDNSEHYKFNAIYRIGDSKFTLKKRKLRMLSP